MGKEMKEGGQRDEAAVAVVAAGMVVVVVTVVVMKGGGAMPVVAGCGKVQRGRRTHRHRSRCLPSKLHAQSTMTSGLL
jgi:hypothetical protein